MCRKYKWPSFLGLVKWEYHRSKAIYFEIANIFQNSVFSWCLTFFLVGTDNSLLVIWKIYIYIYILTGIFTGAVSFRLSTADMGRLISSVRCKLSLTLVPFTKCSVLITFCSASFWALWFVIKSVKKSSYVCYSWLRVSESPLALAALYFAVGSVHGL